MRVGREEDALSPLGAEIAPASASWREFFLPDDAGGECLGLEVGAQVSLPVRGDPGGRASATDMRAAMGLGPVDGPLEPFWRFAGAPVATSGDWAVVRLLRGDRALAVELGVLQTLPLPPLP